MRILLKLIAVISFTAWIFHAKAQQANPAAIGSVKGVLRDTVHNYTVKSATVSVYRADSTLINYQLSNNYGEFSFKNLAPNAKGYIEVSHISYELFRQGFELSGSASTLDLKTLILKPRIITLKEIAISIPPILMNGDTLEFNAAAFKLDSNAVVEDLLRKIPNVTLWGDGQITVNGREVKSLLVNGKEFFGGDFKTATQNIAKNAVEKVQVYNVQKDPKNLLDSTLTINLKLKKGKDMGYFGKIGAGYGSNERFETDGTINIFTPKLQMGIVGASNNVNKIANNIRTLTASSTFKGTGINVEYQPDFRTTGISQTNLGGVTFVYNFIEKPEYNKKNTLTANYFVQNRNNNNSSATQTTTTIGAGNKIFSGNSSTNKALSTNQNFDSAYEFTKPSYQFNISQNVFINTGQSTNQALRSATNQQNILTSTNNTTGQNVYTNKGLVLSADYRYSNYVNYKQKIRNFNARYTLRIADNENEKTDITTFRSFVNASSNRDFNRKYNTNGSSISQQLYAVLPQLKRLFFGDRNLSNVDFDINNDLNLVNSQNNSQVDDFNASAGSYTGNSYLSNNLKTNILHEIPGLTITKSYYKGLSSRYDRSININVSAKQKFSYQESKSDKSSQNIRRSYSNFVPAASFNYTFSQYKEYYNQFGLNFTTDIHIPDIDQLAPLTDSTNQYSLQKGNSQLKEEKSRSLSMSFNHYDQRGKNPFNYSLTISGNFTGNTITDSIFIDNQNKRTIYLANADGYKSANMNASARKSFKLKTSNFQINLGVSMNVVKNPGYINNAFSFSNNLNASSNLNLNYTYKDKLAMETTGTISFYRSRQNAFNTNYSGGNRSATLNGSYNVSKQFTLNSNIGFNTNKPSGSQAIHYNIWNASAIYRFLKGNNAEFKFSALDLLRQNSSVVNNGTANGFTLGTRNVLQQYFMTTFSYYPRQFGKSAVKK